jgi:hypothetical protein
MSGEFAKWRPCAVCGYPKALPGNVHIQCLEEYVANWIRDPLPESHPVLVISTHNGVTVEVKDRKELEHGEVS